MADLEKPPLVEPPREMVEMIADLPIVQTRCYGFANASEDDRGVKGIVEAVIAACTPSVRSQAIEMAAKVADGYSDIMAGREIAASIRSLR